MRRARSPLRIAVVVALVAAAAGCARTPGGGGLPGRVVGLDDTGDGGEYSLGDGWMVSVPEERVTDLWTLDGRSGPPTELAHAQVTLTEDDVASLDGAWAEVTEAGRFRLDAAPGPGVICWLLPDGATDETISRGCAEIDVPAAGTLRATWGEGGFFVGVE